MTIKVFGHKSPDTDATCSALIWAWYLSKIKNTPATAYVLGKPNTEAAFVLENWGFETPETLSDVADDEKVVIVDTNNIQELPGNINQADVIQIIDHHKLVAGLETKSPADITIRPVASTASVMAYLMSDHMEELPREIKGLMLSCILSDTLEFRSPTTTEFDKTLANGLAASLNMNTATYAQKMFEAKSDISHFSDAELIRLDSKKYEAGGKNFRVSVLETTAPAIVLDRKDSLIESFESVQTEDGVDQVLLFVVDIIKEEATLLIPNDLVKNVAEKSFDVSVSGDTVVLPGVVSRKKQIIPNLKV